MLVLYIQGRYTEVKQTYNIELLFTVTATLGNKEREKEEKEKEKCERKVLQIFNTCGKQKGLMDIRTKKL